MSPDFDINFWNDMADYIMKFADWFDKYLKTKTEIKK
jgi:hypothetical protein